MGNHVPEFFEPQGAPVAAVLALCDRSDANTGAQADAGKRAHLIRSAQRHLGVPETSITSEPTGAPIWPNSHRGSLSHWGSKTVCLLAKGNAWDWGADIEGHADADAVQSISQVAMDASERRILAQSDDKGRFCALVFSAKESFFKAAFPRVGRVFGFEALRLLSAPGSGQMNFVTAIPLAPDLPRGTQVTVHYIQVQDAVITWTALQASSPNSLAR
ncbi:4'-phosphopantetheinyl transferase superfamily protein [uncultured Sulfitobacter sp.]|jgi:enterobactin synthetase component D|uniref:4'-phosphopantetheinyl transferase family protein n=1 Tax=uncultured Sulfitobacter sp. TaxID=191468 RepID=UPI0030DB2BF8|tara:strand:+ start:131508 stop:132158 length:651 start_codon:yes stop_codon:yes gene_type:complete